MNSSKNPILAVPTNIITGFLGVGKTSTILNLLKQKPSNERWAVLVNEFGEIGVDGSIFQGEHTEENKVFIREVPGGCMCCTAGISMQIALNMLLTRAKPDRLLIEPTGLGHPLEVLQVLSNEYYQDVLSVQKIITLVDARKLADPRYTENDTFNQQIEIADIIIGNKHDLYSAEDKTALHHYLKDKGRASINVTFTEQGAIDPALLDGPSNQGVEANTHNHHHSPTPAESPQDEPLPACGFLKANNKGEGFESVGWRFSSHIIFDRNKLFHFLSGISAERMKAVFITESGVFAYNLADGSLSEIELDDCLESRIEIIASKTDENWEHALFACYESTLPLQS